MTFPWLLCFFPWLPFSHAFRHGYDCVWQHAQQLQTRKLPYSHDNKQFHDFSMTSSYFPWLFGKFSYSKTFHDFPWQPFCQDFPWPWEPWHFPFWYRSHSWSQCIKNFLSSLSHTVCVVLSVPLLFFFFLGAGTPSHPDSVGCVTDVIGLQCGQTSISITDNGAADDLEGPTGDI